MKRFHVNVAVADLDKSIEFYRMLFGEEPTVVKDDYAKWMLEDPRINFSLNASKRMRGVNHIGLQADTVEELGEIRERLDRADALTFEQPNAECCYARSTKTWVRDPDAVSWETFVTHGSITNYGGDAAPENPAEHTKPERCCA